MPEWSRGEVERLVAEARAEALAEARAMLRERYVAELLDAVEARSAPSTTSGPPPPPREAPAPRETPPAPAPAGLGRWVYGVVPGDAPDPSELIGVDGRHPVELVRDGALAAVTSEVPLDVFGADALQAGLEDLARVEELARAHERVVEAAMAFAGTVVPFRLCTIYAGAEQVRDMLRAEHATFADALERVDGAAEFGVKAYARPVATTTGDADTGTSYLQRRREAREAAESAWEGVGMAVEDVHARLAEQAAATSLGRPQDRRLTGHEGSMVLNASYLVPDERVDRFRALVAELADRHGADGLELELTGPWPPYHFASGAPGA